jgi:hypothetical protein
MYTKQLNNYLQEAFTPYFAMGVVSGQLVRVYLLRLDLQGLAVVFSDKPTQSKRQTVIKYRSTKAKREWMESHALQAFDLCTLADLEKARRHRVNRKGETYQENCGECFEWLLAERFGVSQNEQANLSHRDGGDLEIGGIPYQVKFEKAGIVVTL